MKRESSNMGDAMEAGCRIHDEEDGGFTRQWPVTFSVRWSAEDEMYVGTCDHYRALGHLAEDPCEALKGIMELYEEAAFYEGK